jgi:pyruvate/2-oxoglutarate/acetoin dehydrogenase E1 component
VKILLVEKEESNIRELKMLGEDHLVLLKGLFTKFGGERVRDTTIAEAGFFGAAVGAAMTGLRPIVELMYVDFAGVCFDQMMNQAAKVRYMFGGKQKVSNGC